MRELEYAVIYCILYMRELEYTVLYTIYEGIGIYCMYTIYYEGIGIYCIVYYI